MLKRSHNLPRIPQPSRTFPGDRIASLLTGLLILMTLPALAEDGITAVHENGRTVYVNEERPAAKPGRATAAPVRGARLVYWSVVEKRWKAVPAPPPWAMSAARSAAAEVSTFVSQRPKTAASPARSNPNYRALADGHDVSAEELDRVIDEAASRHNVDPNLVRAVIKVESNFDARAVSQKGAMGLMQLMPQTARQLQVTNPFDAAQNVDAGVRHLKALLNSYNGDVPLTLAAYNAGESAVNRNRGIPPYRETRTYVKRITDLYLKGGGNLFGPASTPVRVFRNADGVLSITNTE